MNRAVYEQLRRRTAGSQVIARLDALSRDLTGGPLLVLLRHGDELAEVCPSGGAADLPEFCRVLRTTPDGRQRCMTCRSLVAFGACYRGLIEYTCHGGISVFAAPARIDGTGDTFAVVISCPFADTDLGRGWDLSRGPASRLGIDLRRLRGAYGKLPGRTEGRAQVARILVDIAASVIGELFRPPDAAGPEAAADTKDLQVFLRSALFVSNDTLPESAGRHSGQKLAEMVIDMVSRDPGMPFTVSKVAAAVRLTPNHFSTLFHRQAGVKFSEFLAEKRLELARKLLRDLSLNISEVAQRAGFRDSSYFARQFKKATGLSPRQWRGAL